MAYLRKTSDIIISNNLRELLLRIENNSEVARLLLKQRHPVETLVDNHVNYIMISKSDNTKISYIPADRLDKVDESDCWHSSMRFISKPGGFVSKLFKNIPAKDIEIFANLYKSQVNRPEHELKIVSGKEIEQWYHADRYSYQGGSLGISCMKYDKCVNYFDIYTKNDKVTMLLMLNNDNYLMGRALLWDFDGHKIMDRIYTINDEKYSFVFKKWADENGYMYKHEQKWNNTLYFESNGRKIYSELSMKLDNFQFDRYPYLDTFKFLDREGMLYNYIPKDKSVYTLISPDGERYSGNYLAFDGITKQLHHYGETVEINYLNCRVYQGNLRWSDINNTHILPQDSIFREDIDDHVFIESLNHFNDLEKIKNKLEHIEARKSAVKKMKMPRPMPYDNGIMDIMGNVNRYSSYFTEYFGNITTSEPSEQPVDQSTRRSTRSIRFRSAEPAPVESPNEIDNNEVEPCPVEAPNSNETSENNVVSMDFADLNESHSTIRERVQSGYRSGEIYQNNEERQRLYDIERQRQYEDYVRTHTRNNRYYTMGDYTVNTQPLFTNEEINIITSDQVPPPIDQSN